MKKYLKYISIAFFLFIGFGINSVEAKDLFTCTYKVNFHNLIESASDKTIQFNLTVTDGKNATSDKVLENASGTKIFANNPFNWQNSFFKNFNKNANDNGNYSCPQLKFYYKNDSVLGTFSSSNDPDAISSISVDGKSSNENVNVAKIDEICTRTTSLRNQEYSIQITFASKGDKKVWKISEKDPENRYSFESDYTSFDEPLTDSQGNMFSIDSNDASLYYFYSSKKCSNASLYLNILSEISTGKYSMLIQSKKPLDINNGAFDVQHTKFDDGHHDNNSNSNSNSNNDNETVTTTCDDLPETTKLVKQIYGLIKYLIPVLVIGLSIVDFLKVLLNGEEKVYKEAWSKFVKRLIIGVVILILPIILSFIINLSGALDSYGVDKNNIFCIFS